MELNKLGNKHPGNLTYFFKELHSLGFLPRLQSILEEISATPNASQSPEIYSSNLKTVLGLLTDQTFQKKYPKYFEHPKSNTSSEPSKTSQKPNTSETSKPVQPKLTTALSGPSKVRPSTSYANLKTQRLKHEILTESLEYISDFEKIKGAATFFKQERKLIDYQTLSPGPAAYSPRSDTYIKRSPRAIIPNGGKRFDFADPETPSPMCYYPRIHFIAK